MIDCIVAFVVIFIIQRPPRIVSYENYKKQKEKLRRSLYLQGVMMDDEGFGGVFNDAASLDSKESEESSEGVITATLINLEDDDSERRSIPYPIIIRPTSDDDDETDSASIISSSSGSSGNKMCDVSPADEDVHVQNEKPRDLSVPVPPPRRKHQMKQQHESAAVGTLIDLNSDSSTSQPAAGTNNKDDEGSLSSLNDFTSGIAETLVKISKRCSDPMVANTVSHMGQDLFNCVDNNATNPSKMTPVMEKPNDPWTPDKPNDPWKPEKPNDPWKPVEMSPNLSTNTRPAPPKPQPYIGTGYKLFMETSQPGVVMAPNVTNTSRDNPSLSSDPLANIFGNGGLHGYAFEQKNDNDKTGNSS